MKLFTKILWLIISIIPILFWYFVYKASITEYEENVIYFFLAVIISITTTICLILLRLFDTENFRKRKIIRIYSNLLGTPITVIALILYIENIQMSWKWNQHSSTEEHSYNITKRQNIFKSEYELILDKFSTNPDTIISNVKRNGDIEIYKKINGKLSEISDEEIEKIKQKEYKKILEY